MADKEKYTLEEVNAIRSVWSVAAVAFVGLLGVKSFNYAASVERLDDVLDQCEAKGLAQESLYNDMFYARSRNGQPNSKIILHNQLQSEKGHWYSSDAHYECSIKKNYMEGQPFSYFVQRR